MKPNNLPGGNGDFDFDTSFGLSADFDPPVQINGVNPGEWVELLLSLSAAKSLSDVSTALSSGALRGGLHVQGFADGGSETFVNSGAADGPQLAGGVPAPEPHGLALIVLGVTGWMYSRHRLRSKSNTGTDESDGGSPRKD